MPTSGNKPVCIRLTANAIAFLKGLGGIVDAVVKVTSGDDAESPPSRPGGIGVKGGVAEVGRRELLARMSEMGWDSDMKEVEARKLGAKLHKKRTHSK